MTRDRGTSEEQWTFVVLGIGSSWLRANPEPDPLLEFPQLLIGSFTKILWSFQSLFFSFHLYWNQSVFRKILLDLQQIKLFTGENSFLLSSVSECGLASQ